MACETCWHNATESPPNGGVYLTIQRHNGIPFYRLAIFDDDAEAWQYKVSDLMYWAELPKMPKLQKEGEENDSTD